MIRIKEIRQELDGTQEDLFKKCASILKIKKEQKLDMVIHLGDIEGSEYTIEQAVDCPVEMVSGNNDFFSDISSEKTLQIGKYCVMITHGHRYYIGMGNEMLKKEAVARGVDIVMYGHTHRPVIDIGKEVIAINPGSLSYPRQDNRKPSYILMEIDEKGDAHFELRYLE